jgi:hypothetical protein
MFLRDSVGSKIEFWGWGISPTGLIWAGKWTNASSFSATRATGAQTTLYQIPTYWEIEKDATHYYLRYGYSEIGLVELTSFTHTNFLDAVADQIGLTCYADTASGTAITMDVGGFYRVA